MTFNPVIDLLIVDDDLHVLAVLEDLFLIEKDIRVVALSDSLEAMRLVKEKRFDVVITDLMMPQADGLEVTRAVHEAQPNALVIIITGFASLETTLEAIHLGVYDYITKPFQIDEFRLLVSNAAKRIRLERENIELKAQVGAVEGELSRLQGVHAELLVEMDTVRREVERREGQEEGASAAAPAPSGAGKIGQYGKMAEDYRVRLMRQREQLGLGRRAAAPPPEA